MNPTSLKALLAVLPAFMLAAGAVRVFLKARTLASVLQLLGSGGLAIVILAHLCEGLRLLPAMGWGLEHSPGHYVDLSGALLAAALFPLGYLLHAFTNRNA